MDVGDVAFPRNTRKYRRLDCAVFEYAYKMVEETRGTPSIDTTRGVYVPAGGNRRVWSGSWISQDSHIQLCVRNPASLLGAWLHYPTNLESDDVCQAIQADASAVSPPDRPGQEADEGDASGQKT